VGEVISREKAELGASAAPEGIEVARPRAIVNTNVEIDYSPRKLVVRDKGRRWAAIVERRGKKLSVDVWVRRQDGELEEVDIRELGNPLELLGLDLSKVKELRSDLEPEEVRSGIGLALANWDKEIRRQEAQIALSDISVIPDRVTDKEVLAYEIARVFIERFGAVGVYFETPRGKSLAGVLCYEGGVYSVCEDWLKSQYAQFLEKPQQHRVTKSVIEEAVKYKVPALNSVVVSYGASKPLIAFENGIFDWEVFIVTGDIDKALRPFDRSLFVMHKIPHRLSSSVLKEARLGLEKYVPPKDVSEVLFILRSASPKAYELLRSWAWYEGVSEQLLVSRVGFLLEMVGRALLPGYRLFGDIVFKDIFVLLGPTNSGKSTFLISLLGNTILGERNYATSKISSLTTNDDEDIRRLFGTLFNVLAVFLPDISKNEVVRNWSYIRSLSGGDPVEARRLRENIFWYYPAYKIYMASNDPPNISEGGEAKNALLSRFKVIEFKNVFTNGELNLRSYLREEDVEVIILCSLYALRLAYQRKGYSPTGVVDVEDVWLRYSEPAYRLVMEMVERGILALDPTLEISSGDLYNAVNEYAREKARRELGGEVDEEDVREVVGGSLPGDQAAFTKKMKSLLARYGVKVVKRGNVRVFKGIGFRRGEVGLGDHAGASR